MRWTTILWSSCAVLCLCAQALAANDKSPKMYKWTDADGSVHYSAAPPEGDAQAPEEVVLRRGPKAEPAASTAAPAADPAKVARCMQLRENVRLLESDNNEIQISENGMTRPLTAAEREPQLAAARAGLKDCTDEPAAAPAE